MILWQLKPHAEFLGQGPMILASRTFRTVGCFWSIAGLGQESSNKSKSRSVGSPNSACDFSTLFFPDRSGTLGLFETTASPSWFFSFIVYIPPSRGEPRGRKGRSPPQRERERKKRKEKRIATERNTFIACTRRHQGYRRLAMQAAHRHSRTGYDRWDQRFGRSLDARRASARKGRPAHHVGSRARPGTPRGSLLASPRSSTLRW